MDSVFLDTSAWAALFLENDANHEAAVLTFERLKHAKTLLYTSDYVVDETITLAKSRSGHTTSVAVGRTIFESDLVKMILVMPDHKDATRKIYEKYSDKNFSFTDASIMAVMSALKTKKLFSFDGEFRKVGIELLS